jgi:hypothetical protein
MYRKAEIKVKSENNAMSRANITTDIQYSHAPLYGSLKSRIGITPVDRLTVNHLLQEIQLQSTSKILTELTKAQSCELFFETLTSTSQMEVSPIRRTSAAAELPNGSY